MLGSTYGAIVSGNRRIISAMRSVFSINSTAACRNFLSFAKRIQRLLILSENMHTKFFFQRMLMH